MRTAVTRLSSGRQLKLPTTRWAFISSCVWSWRYALWAALSVAILRLLVWLDWPANELHRQLWSLPLGSVVVFWLSTLSKPAARRACKILLLRGFEQERRRSLYQKVFPIIGCYGRLIALRDPMERPRNEMVGAAQSAFLSDVDEHSVALGEWQDKVGELLKEADFAVVDVTHLTEAVRWELLSCIENLPPERILTLCEFTSDRYANIKAAMHLALEHGVPLEQFDFAIYFTWRTWPLKFWKAWPLKFERQIARYMSKFTKVDP
jgi:hypothetical protein